MKIQLHGTISSFQNQRITQTLVGLKIFKRLTTRLNFIERLWILVCYKIFNFNLLQNSMPIKISILRKCKSAHGIGPCFWTRLKDSWTWKIIAPTKIASLRIWRTKLKSTFGELMKTNLSNPILVYNVKTAMKGSFRK